jgi:hypothetical protein
MVPDGAEEREGAAATWLNGVSADILEILKKP